MKSVIERHFQQLTLLAKQKSKEEPVHKQWLELFEELEQLSSDSASGASLPCFKVRDTSKAGFLTSPSAKADFTFYTNNQVGRLGNHNALSLRVGRHHQSAQGGRRMGRHHQSAQGGRRVGRRRVNHQSYAELNAGASDVACCSWCM